MKTLCPPALMTKAASGHVVRFFDDADALLTELTEFIAVACRAGGVGVVIATPGRASALMKALHALSASPGNGSGEWVDEHLIVLDARSTLNAILVEGWPEEQRFMRVVGNVIVKLAGSGKTIHAFGEMVALLCEEGKYEAALHLEGLWNILATRHTFALFCAYPAKLFNTAERSAAFQHVCDAHSHVLPGEDLSKAVDPGEASRLLAFWQHKAAVAESEASLRRETQKVLQRRERELADFVENAAEGLHRVGGDGVIQWANRAELGMLGYSAEDYIGHPIAKFHVDQAVIQQILACLVGGNTLYDQPARLRCKDGSIKHVLIHSNGYFEDGKLIYTRCFTRDVTDQVLSAHALEAAHAERERLVAELLQASQAKDEFLAMLGHELRNPLSPIVTALQLMRMRGASGTEREQAIIQRQVDHLVRLVDDLLDISKITRGKIELRKDWVQIGDVLGKAAEMASVILEQRRHHLAVHVEPGLCWHGDASRLAQVVANLLTNAAHYSDCGSSISLVACKTGDDKVVISVKDSGVGISRELLPRIFDLFVQGHRNIDRAEGGLGVGLALVKNLVELHGGTVVAQSPGLGQGSEFTISLPVLRMPPLAPTYPAASIEATQQAACPRRIMLVDDNQDAVSTLGELLRAVGHSVRVFNDPAEALQALDGFCPELALLDIGLPTMDGYELAAAMRSKLGAQECRFIALTGYGQSADKARSAQADFAAHLVKPIRGQDLLSLIDRH